MAKTKWADLPVHKRLAAEQLGFLSGLCVSKRARSHAEKLDALSLTCRPLQNRWDDPETGSSAADAAATQLVFRCGSVKFQETNRTVPYLLVPRGATQSSEGQHLLLKHMRNVFKLDDTFFKLDDFGLRQGSPPTVVLRVCPGENLRRFRQILSASVNESVEVNDRDESTPRSRSSLGESSIAGDDTQSFLSLSSPASGRPSLEGLVRIKDDGVGSLDAMAVDTPRPSPSGRRASVNESVEANDLDEFSTQALDCISKAIAFVLECKGCFITSADRTRGIVSCRRTSPSTHPLYSTSYQYVN